MKHFSIYNQVFSMSLSQHCIVLHFILKDGNVVFFPACIFLYKKKNQIPISVWISVFVFNFVLLINMSIFISIHCSFFFHYNFVAEFEIRCSDSPWSSFTIQEYFSYPGFVCLCVFPFETVLFNFSQYDYAKKPYVWKR